MELAGAELQAATATFKTALAKRPNVSEKPFSSFKRA
jgi:hypothetical protein